MKSSAKKIELASVDDLFSTEEGRQDAEIGRAHVSSDSVNGSLSGCGFPKLQIDGILLTMVDSRTNFAKEISALLRETYGSKIKVFGTEIPHSVRAKEISAEGKSIFAHDPGGKVAEGYRNLTKEVLKLEKQREKNRAGIGR